MNVDVSSEGKATILEVKEEKGVGIILDTVLYDGNIKKGDVIVIGSVEEPIVTKVKGIFKVENKKLSPISKSEAASFIKIVATDIGEVIAGMPLLVANNDLEEKKRKVEEEIEEVLIETDNEGVVVKADSLGSLEALVGLLKENDVPIKRASLGNITKKDIAEASAEENILFKTILAFNVKVIDSSKEVKIINKNIIYQIVDEYKEWEDSEKRKEETKVLNSIKRPFKLMIIPGCIFRQSNPAVVGVEVMQGVLRQDSRVMNESGKSLGEIDTVQLEGKSIKEAERGKQVAIAMPKIIANRHVFENEILYSDFNEEEFRRLKDMKSYLKEDEISILKVIAEIKRRENSLWGV